MYRNSLVQKVEVRGGDPALQEYEARPGKNLERGDEYEECDTYEEPEACWAN